MCHTNLSYDLLKRICEELTEKILLSEVSFLHYTSFFHGLSLELKKEGKHEFLNLFLHPSLCLLYLGSKPPTSSPSIFIQKLQKALTHTVLTRFSLQKDNRIVTFEFSKKKTSFFLIIEFFSQPAAYLINEEMNILASTKPSREGTTYTYKHMPMLEPTIASWEEVGQSATLHKEIEMLAQEALRQKAIQEKTKALQRKLDLIEKGIEQKKEEIEECTLWREYQHKADLVKAHYHLLKEGKELLLIPDWNNDNVRVSISVDPTLSPQKQLAKLYQKSQKLKKAQTPLKKMLEKLEKEKSTCHEELTRIPSYTLKELIQEERKQKSDTTKKVELPYHRFLSSKGFEILVGKNSKGNMFLTFHVAKKGDLWLHASHVAGAHVIIKSHSGNPFDEQTVLEAATLALYFSKARGQEKGFYEVVVTERTYVSRIAQAKEGTVSISKHKPLSVPYNKEIVTDIFSRSNHPL